MTGNRKNKIKKKLEILAKEDKLFCKKYKEAIGLETLYRKRCYTIYSKKRYCKYVEIKKG